MLTIFAFLATLSYFVISENCTSGGAIYYRGVTESMAQEIEDMHNAYRLQIAQGLVDGQIMGTNLKKMKYDQNLAKLANIVTDTCKIGHILGKDARWPHIGQNLYMVWSSFKRTTPNWNDAMTAWFIEHKNFTYPNKRFGKTGHYTQLIWATTDHVGCDFIAFYDKDPIRVRNPHARLYACNYGPGGNILGVAPYEIGEINECPNLC